jgi:hypothetical protein
MEEQPKTINIDDAVAVAEAVLSGAVSAPAGCSQIAGICRALNAPKELALFELLAHEQHGHEHIGITAASLEPEIMQACKELVASQLTRRSTGSARKAGHSG